MISSQISGSLTILFFLQDAVVILSDLEEVGEEGSPGRTTRVGGKMTAVLER